MPKQAKNRPRKLRVATAELVDARRQAIRAALERGEDPPAMYTVIEVARMLQLSRAKVYGMAAANILPSIKFGDRAVRIPAAELTRWIAAHTREGA